MKKIIIAIDGYSSTGKSTTAKEVAKRLGYFYVDTGAMYRAVAFLADKEGLLAVSSVLNNNTQKFEQVFDVDQDQLIEKLKQNQIQFKYNFALGFSELFLNGENIEKEIRSMHIASIVSQIAKLPKIRAFMVDIQRKMGQEKGLVMDGRDVGTVVFPSAELKIFMTASPQIRAERRLAELTEKGEQTTFEEVLKNLTERDYIDTTRAESPLKKAEDAIELDNTYLTIEEQIQIIIDKAKIIIDK